MRDVKPFFSGDPLDHALVPDQDHLGQTRHFGVQAGQHYLALVSGSDGYPFRPFCPGCLQELVKRFD